MGHRERRRRQKRWGASLLGACLWLAACSCGSEPERPEPPAPAASGLRGGSAAPLGELRLVEGRVSGAVADVMQLSVLEQLAEQAGFELTASATPPRRVTLRLEDVALAEAIAAILTEERYALRYRPDAAGPPRLARVEVGAPSESASLATPERAAAPTDEQSPGPETDPARLERIEELRERIAELRRDLVESRNDAQGRQRIRARLYGERQSFQEELEKALAHPDPRVRAAAIPDLDLDEGDARERVGEAGRLDPDPEVRAAAAQALADDGTYVAVSRLLQMLEDPDPAVLTATIEGLSFAGDETLIEFVAPFRGHPDPGVREQAQETLGYWDYAETP